MVAPPFRLPAGFALPRPIKDIPANPQGRIEAKLDGWRAMLHTASGGVWSRHGTDLSHAFSDVAEVAGELEDAVLDVELVAVTHAGEVAFERLQTRAGRGPRRAADFSVHAVAFDVLALGDADLRDRPCRERRVELLRLLDGGPPSVRPVPATSDIDEAMTWIGALGGVEGLVFKPEGARYVAGRTGSGWLKWRERHTTEAVILGVSGHSPRTQALILGRPRGGRMVAVGVSLPLDDSLRRDLASLLHAAGSEMRELPGTVGGLPGTKPVAYMPVQPEVVVELAVDQPRLELGRYRHRPRVMRIRGDLTANMLSEVER